MITIGKRKIGPGEPPFLILEAGINHNGDVGRAIEMIRFARSIDADAVKFQTFKAEEFITDPNLTYTYKSQGKEVTESQIAMFKRYEFSPAQWREVKAACDAEGIVFLSTPQNVGDLDILLDLGVPAIKIGSDDFTNIPLLKHYAATGLPLILSCGMADMGEVAKSLGAVDRSRCALLVCTSSYPTRPVDVNIARVTTLMGAFPDVVIGYSDHTESSDAAVMATALGASLFEKHFTLDHDLPGPDHWFSADRAGASQWVKAVRTATTMRGDGVVRPTAEEQENRKTFRRSVTALRPIAAGEAFTATNVGLRRPAAGLPPDRFESVLGRRAKRALAAGDQLSDADLG